MKYLIIAAPLFLAGCITPQAELAKDKIYGVVSTVKEDLTDASVDYICSIASVGVVRKKFWSHAGKEKNWAEFCAMNMIKDTGI